MHSINIKTKTLEIANKYYPHAQCVILTGSQIEPEALTPLSDIDIIIIDKHFVGMSCDCIKEDNNKVDFTRLGYLNFMDILIDNSYSGNPVIFEMLKNCILLKDTTGIAELAIRFCRVLIENGNNDLQNEGRILKAGLIKLRKHIQKKLDQRYSLFLITDFLRLTTSAHLFILNKGWYPYDGFRLVKFTLINDKNPAFLDNIIKLTEDYINAPAENIRMIISYIDKYLFALNKPCMTHHFNKRTIINLNFRGQNHTCFYKDICYSILENPYLSKYFILSQNHSYKYIFKYTYSIIFNNTLDGFDELSVTRELEELFFKQRARITDFSMINPYYIYVIFYDEEIYDPVELLLSFINKEIIQMVYLTGSYNEKKIFLIGVIISLLLIKSLKMIPKNIHQICSYLMQKWTPRDYLQDINHLNISSILEKREKHFNDVYVADYEIYKRIGTDFLVSMNLSYDDIDLKEIIFQCENVTKTINQTKIQLPEVYTLSICINNLSNEEKRTTWYISNILEMIFNTIGIAEENRSYIAYVLGQIYK